VKLYSFGEVDEEFLRGELADLRREKSILQDRLRAARPAPAALPSKVDQRLLSRACLEVERWLDQAGDTDRQLALEALQIAVVATTEQATVSGIIPTETLEFFILQRASA
jgi:hypothetical protein